MTTTQAPGPRSHGPSVAASTPSPARTWGTVVASAAVLVAVGALAAAVATEVSLWAALLLPLAVAAPAVLVSRPVAAAALVAVVVPVGLVRVPGPLPLQLVDVAALATIALVALHRAVRGSAPIVVRAPLGWGLALTVVVTISALVSADRAVALPQAAQLLVGAALAASVTAAVTSVRDIRRLLWAAVAVSAALCSTTLTGGGQLRAEYAGGLVANRAVGIFASPNELGTFAAMTLVLAGGLWLTASRRAERLLAVGCVALIGTGLALSLSRGAWLGGAVGVASLVVLLPRARRPLLVGLVVATIALPAAVVALPDNTVVRTVTDRYASIFAEDGGNPYDLRPDILRIAPHMALEHPWTGVGPAGFAAAFERDFYTSFGDVSVHAHNFLLTATVEAGVAAGALLLAFAVHLAVVCVRSVTRLRRRRDPAGAGLAAALGSALAALAGHGLVDFTLRNALLALFTWWVVGLLLAIDRTSVGGEHVPAGMP